jgi:dihydropteroate synthase
MADAGAHIIDVGGESTRPGAGAVTADQELERVLPVIEAIAAELPLPVSVDTSKPEVMRAAVAAGAGMVNDVRALREPGALEVVCELAVPVCLMHMLGEPRSMQSNPCYLDVVAEVAAFLEQRLQACQSAGIAAERVLLDPGFGFGKTLEHNLQLLRNLSSLVRQGHPLVVGLSRKSLISAVTGADLDARVPGSVALAVMAAERGARVVRVHDVAETVQALRLHDAVSYGI